MKKLLTIALMLLVELTANAQGTWSKGMLEGDELKGTTDGPYYLYEVEGMGSFVVWDFDDWAFKINSENGVFDVWHNNQGSHYIYVTLGLYTLDGKLTEKWEGTIKADHVALKMAWINKNAIYYPSTRKKLKKMFRALKSGEGYVRIISKRRNVEDFDLKVMPYKEPVEEE
jgi:hypothetical protein